MDLENTGARLQRKSLFEFWRSTSRNNKIDQVIKYVKSKFNKLTLPQDQEKRLKTFLKNECEKIRVKWVRKKRRLDEFLQSHGHWLNQDLVFDMFTEVRDTCERPSTSKRGRPQKSFSDSGPRTKKRKIQHLLEKYDDAQLSFAAEVSVRTSGKRDAANIIKEVSIASPRRATGLKKSRRRLSEIRQQQRPYTAEEALALFIASDFTVQTYKNIQQESKERGFRLYPCYDRIAKIKKLCHPPVEKITMSDNYAEVELQALLDHTTSRICINILGKALLENSNTPYFTMVYKWGCDGSSGHSIYKQPFFDATDTDEYMFVVSLVPLRLQQDNGGIVWESPRPSSPRFCRVIKFVYKKETDSLIKEEVTAIEKQIEDLVSTSIHIEDKQIFISHKLILSMVDGKVCNVLAENTSSQRCFICKATSSEMNIDITKEPDESMYRFGISSLHAYIRSMECLLNIASRIDLKVWQARGKENKAIVKNRRANIIEKFKLRGLIIDKVRPGFGTSNDGNTARAFFKNYKETAAITGIDKDLIHRLGTILAATASGFEIDPEKYEAYCKETRTLYLSLYKWYNMPATLHKILIHGADIIRFCLIPIGQMSEEASEAKNKEIRKVRLGHTLKTSRVRTNFDLIKYLLVSSDPYISLLRKLPKKSVTRNFNDLKLLLK